MGLPRSADRMPSAPTTVSGTSSGTCTGASSAIHAPSARLRSCSAAARNASRVLPIPPEPSSVTSRCVASPARTEASSCLRPTKLDSSAGTLLRRSAGVPPIAGQA